MNLIKYRNLFFAFSLLIIVPGLVAFTVWGLKLGIDFTGGTIWEVKFSELQSVDTNEVRKLLDENGAQSAQVAATSQNSTLIRMKATDENKINELKSKLNEKFKKTEIIRLDTVGPTISKELTNKAMLAVAVAIVGIVLYITWSFRSIPKPTSSLAFGFCTVFALVHDVIVVVGIFAILGHFFAIEVDSLFITALLTVIGFSVHDTIVVFDRIRENLKKSNLPFEEVINGSLLQTMSRSLNTSLTAVFVLLALFLFGGESIKYFVLALLVGIISGTYSSIFNAAPLLVTWNNQRARLQRRKG